MRDDSEKNFLYTHRGEIKLRCKEIYIYEKYEEKNVSKVIKILDTTER